MGSSPIRRTRKVKMIDTEKRNPGKYKEEYSEIFHGKKVHVTEETVVGRNFEIISFSKEYNPPIPYKMPPDGEYENSVTKVVKGKTIITETRFVIENGTVISHETNVRS